MPIHFGLDTDVVFGIGAKSQIGTVVRTHGRRVALVTGLSSLAESGHAETILASIANAGAFVVTRLTVAGEPEVAGVVDAARQFRAAEAEVVLAIGGGSVIDLAKAAAVVADESDARAKLAGDPVTEAGIPVVAVPTTAGTGAEASRGAIVLDLATNRKRGIRGRKVAPRAAVVDPELTIAAPPTLTAQAGFDAMSHAIETSVSSASSRLNVLLAGEACRLLLAAVPESMENPSNLSARTDASYSALLMGVNLATATTCLPHRMQYPVGAASGTPHARGVAALFPAWLQRTAEYAPERLATLASYARLVEDGEEPRRAAATLIEAVIAWMASIGMSVHLSELGVSAQDIEDLAAMVEGTLTNDPGPTTPDALTELYRASL